ncbi:MAG: PhoH family protein [Pseudomonadota bacterium]
MVTSKHTGKRLFVLDSNVLMHDPACLFRFHEHDVYVPMMVLEELDGHKRGNSEIARNTRQASRFIEDVIKGATQEQIKHGLPLPAPITGNFKVGKLFVQTEQLATDIPNILPGNKSDNSILGTALALRKTSSKTDVVLVSKDINMRIKAAALGIPAEDYYNDQVLDDVNLLYTGATALADDFWEKQRKDIKTWHENGRTFYEITHEHVAHWYPNQFIYSTDDSFDAIVREKNGTTARLELLQDFRNARNTRHNVWGVNARNREQNFALNVLMDPDIDFVTLLGQAGSGKTLLTLAAAMNMTLEQKRFSEIIVTRVTIPVGEDIGFLPGTEEEKMTPWMGALMDNLDVLTNSGGAGDWERAATHDLLKNRIKIRSLNFMRGRTFLNKFLIIDEAQNLTSKQMKTLITRAGPGTKVVCLGNVAQIDTPYLTETTSGLTYVVDRFKSWPHGAHITLQRGERSRLADYASEAL